MSSWPTPSTSCGPGQGGKLLIEEEDDTSDSIGDIDGLINHVARNDYVDDDKN